MNVKAVNELAVVAPLVLISACGPHPAPVKAPSTVPVANVTGAAPTVTTSPPLKAVGSEETAKPSGTDPLRPPPLRAQTIDGQPVTLPNATQVTVIHFWATWCEPCKKSLQELDAFSVQNPAVEVIAVSVDDDGGQSIPAFLASFPAPHLRIVWDDGGRIAETFAPSTMPTTLVYGPREFRVIRGYHPGDTALVADAARAVKP